ncbi:class I SAM-dependent DNA methyltransferase [Leptospira sarikeiensis]|uniref:Class I SAM-dependent methyltransferase n=1 Tax=Leptospira sarikeiensis TaxID=2484943 RepID=A0A4R9KFT6_9LEPT|nr:class I SAM-dependent methyltransferase [Leptospira sarikeiensis]TGL64092.1 class I SAM-dependent methyltransferase [Leptospira sarikeiensis]
MEDNIFDQIANSYDSEERKELARIIANAIKPKLKESKNKSLLDFGCGTGLVGLELAPFVDKIFFTDSSEQMLEIINKKIIQGNIKNAEVIPHGSTAGIRVDIIIVSLVLLHIPAVSETLSQLYSILNANGKLIIVDFNKNEKINHPKVHNGFTNEELKSLFENAGFKNIEIQTFHHGKNIFIGQDASLFISTSLK